MKSYLQAIKNCQLDLTQAINAGNVPGQAHAMHALQAAEQNLNNVLRDTPFERYVLGKFNRTDKKHRQVFARNLQEACDGLAAVGYDKFRLPAEIVAAASTYYLEDAPYPAPGYEVSALCRALLLKMGVGVMCLRHAAPTGSVCACSAVAGEAAKTGRRICKSLQGAAPLVHPPT
jgi:hypothetical protein